MSNKPHFVIKNKFQKRAESYKDVLTTGVLTDVCTKLTGEACYSVDYDEVGYNVGRLAILEYNNKIYYISFSEKRVASRNSFFQSFPSALIKFHQETNPNKRIVFYFLGGDGNIETPYFVFMYRLMKTAGATFINEEGYLKNPITRFSSPFDIEAQRTLNKAKSTGNASSYITTSEDNIWQIFGKTYGANKYETVLLFLALREIIPNENLIELYEIQEGNLNKLPKESRDVIGALNAKIITSDIQLEQQRFEKSDSLRSPAYIFNLLAKLGNKKCVLCGCEIPQIIQGAHIWPVSNIKKIANIDMNEKIKHATAGDNGLWLCNNHHKLFDSDILYIATDGVVKYKQEMQKPYEIFLKSITNNHRIDNAVLSGSFLYYLRKRNKNLDENEYSALK